MSPTFDPYASQQQSAQQPAEVPSSELQPVVKSHLIKAILSTCLCFVPLGIVAIVFASQVNVRLEYGDQAGAIKASRQASFYGNLSIWLGLFSYVLMLVLVALAWFAGSNAKAG